MFSFKKKKKKITLRQMHSLYLLLKHALPEKDESLLIDQLDKMLDKMQPGTVSRCMNVLEEKTEGKSDVLVFITFTRILKECRFFGYVDFIKDLHGRRNSN